MSIGGVLTWSNPLSQRIRSPTSRPGSPPGITGGVDTHLEVHVAAALDPLGRLIGSESFATDAKGYRELLAWLRSFGEVTMVGVEGTGSYGAGLARFLRRQGVHVVEVMRPNRQARRNSGKTDALDAVEAARAALSGKAKGHAKTRDGAAEAIRTLVVAKRSARQARVKAIVQMRHLVVKRTRRASPALQRPNGRFPYRRGGIDAT